MKIIRHIDLDRAVDLDLAGGVVLDDGGGHTLPRQA